MTYKVMSSITSSSLFQASVAIYVNSRQAPSGSPLYQYFDTILTHVLLSINSQMPSDAITMNLSSLFSSSSKNSGSGMTPTELATQSPIDRLIASPGMFSSFSHTHAGPIGWPSGSLKGSTLPFDIRILSNSSFLSGLWSIERVVATQCIPFSTTPVTDSI